ncbi:hypothetical protein D3C77_158650 [compost metagenome]
MIETAIVQDRFASAEGDPRSVDKTATVAADAIRVGNDNPRRLPRYFGIAAKLTGVTAVDLVKDGACSLAAQIRVAENDPAQLGCLCTTCDVVENQPFTADVVVPKLVVRQPTGVGCGNVDDRHAITRALHGRPRSADDQTIGQCPQRLPEHGVGQQQCHSPLGQAAEAFTPQKCGRRLAKQEGKLMDVHV